jgi:hypothetical protein
LYFFHNKVSLAVKIFPEFWCQIRYIRIVTSLQFFLEYCFSFGVFNEAILYTWFFVWYNLPAFVYFLVSFTL